MCVGTKPSEAVYRLKRRKSSESMYNLQSCFSLFEEISYLLHAPCRATFCIFVRKSHLALDHKSADISMQQTSLTQFQSKSYVDRDVKLVRGLNAYPCACEGLEFLQQMIVCKMSRVMMWLLSLFCADGSLQCMSAAKVKLLVRASHYCKILRQDTKSQNSHSGDTLFLLCNLHHKWVNISLFFATQTRLFNHSACGWK